MKIKRMLMMVSIGAALMVAAQSQAVQTDEYSGQNYLTMTQPDIGINTAPVLNAVAFKQVRQYTITNLEAVALQVNSVAPDKPGEHTLVGFYNNTLAHHCTVRGTCPDIKEKRGVGTVDKVIAYSTGLYTDNIVRSNL